MARWKARVEFLLSVIGLLFTARRIASAVLATAIPSVRLSVCPSVRPSHAGIVLKRRHVARCSLHCQIGKCHWSQDFTGKGSSPCQYIDTTRKAVDCATTVPLTVFMAALCKRGAIIFLPCSFFLLLSIFFPRLISAAGDWMSTILPHMVWP